jgi:hypothetical protein
MVPARMKTDLHSGFRERANLRGADTRELRIRSDRLDERRRERISILRLERFDKPSEVVNRGRRGTVRVGGGQGTHEVVKLRCSLVYRPLKPLPPEREWGSQRCSREKEGGVSADSFQNREREASMRGEIVVECNGDREPLAAPPSCHRIGEFSSGHDPIPRCQMAQLRFEQTDAVRRQELRLRITGSLSKAVIREGDPCSKGRAAQEALNGRRNGHPEHSDQGVCYFLEPPPVRWHMQVRLQGRNGRAAGYLPPPEAPRAASAFEEDPVARKIGWPLVQGLRETPSVRTHRQISNTQATSHLQPGGARLFLCP